MQNPFLRVVVNGVKDDYLRLTYRSLTLPFICYSFLKHIGMAGPGYLVVVPKESFSSAQDAMTAMIQRILYEDEEWTNNYCIRFTEEDIKWLTNDFLIPVYAKQEIRQISPDKFRTEYDYIINLNTRYTHIREDKTSFEGYYTEGITKNGEDIADYINFDPIHGEVLEECYSVFDNEQNRTEYFAISPLHYIYLFWFWPHEKLSPFRGWKD